MFANLALLLLAVINWILYTVVDLPSSDLTVMTVGVFLRSPLVIVISLPLSCRPGNALVVPLALVNEPAPRKAAISGIEVVPSGTE